ncbi:hypothetical protein NQ166_11240 [Microbacterium sp. zg.Y1090]|uniref:hypothetical protein n=1 Tax=Microbacterium TaxID=33882 RepID=UPI00214B67A7|nr:MULTISPECIES: hypothetical protein [unclassified Microbacterium]MCR2813082.1 hypothetical protein [Microbacterium sp. zg.Y1084]MCR2819396.1 hypothetical protein [Microbacterium sp. zg.Y1090]WIM28375.1 hypothetical protein QNO26_00310 [Microbacterium sp. zg-Y1090]
MDELFRFLGNYWWLAFPLAGVFGGLGRAWEQAAKRRHKRRLEVLRAKSELKAAQAAARARPVATASVPTAIMRPAPEPSQVEQLFAAHDAVTQRWLEYELDVAKLIAFPTMSDGREPMTAAFLRAKKTADRLRPPSAKAKVTAEELNEYRAAVTEFEVAFDLAEREARRVRDSSFTEGERKRLATAQQLLSVAVDQAASSSERQTAYKRVREELNGLIALSDEAIDVLKTKVSLELPRGSTPAPDAP